MWFDGGIRPWGRRPGVDILTLTPRGGMGRLPDVDYRVQNPISLTLTVEFLCKPIVIH